MSLEKFTYRVVIVIVMFVLGVWVYYGFLNKPTHPVERNVIVDSLTKVNDSIKIKVNNLDSIKNAKIIEVEALDNDSTLKLFYELIRE